MYYIHMFMDMCMYMHMYVCMYVGGVSLSCHERQIGRVRNVLERRSQGRRS